MLPPCQRHLLFRDAIDCSSPLLFWESFRLQVVSGEGQGERCFVNSAWDLEPGSNFQSSRYSATQCRLFRMVMSGAIWERSEAKDARRRIGESDSVSV